MNCKNCGKAVSVKQGKNWVSLLCKCGCFVVYSDWHTRWVSEKEYFKNKEREEKNGLQRELWIQKN